ncbi:RBMS2, partial [Symbiodinium sp. CCMP2456]
HEEIPEGRLPPVPEGPGVQGPVEGEPPEIPEGAEEEDPSAAPGEPAPEVPAAPMAPESPPEPPAPKKLLQPTPSSAAKWGWWRNSRVVPEPDAGAFTRHVVRFKDGVQLGPPRVERVWIGRAEGAQGSGYASSLPSPPAAPPAPSTLPALPEAIGTPEAWQIQEAWDRLSKPALVPVSIPGCAHLSYGSAAEACQDLRLAGGAGAPIVVVAVSSQGLARQAGVLPGFTLLALNGHDLKGGQLTLSGEELLPSLARSALGQTRLDFMDPTMPQSHLGV